MHESINKENDINRYARMVSSRHNLNDRFGMINLWRAEIRLASYNEKGISDK